MEKNRRNLNLNLLLCIGLFFVFTIGCSQFSQLRPKKTDIDISQDPARPINASNGKPNDLTENESSGLSEKSNLYINECHNKYSNRVVGSFKRYQSWIKDFEKGPTGKESIVYGLYDVNGDGQDCLQAISKAKTMQPSMPEAEAVAEKYSTALNEAISQIKGIYSYYDQEDYKDDNFQKGKDAHQGLVKAFSEFEVANREFSAEIDKLEDKVSEEQLSRFKDDPDRKFEYALVDSGIKAKKIVSHVNQDSFDQLKAEDLQPLVDAFDKSLADAKTLSKSGMASGYFSACDEFLKASKELTRRVRDKQPFSDFEKRQLGTFSGWMVDGSPDKVVNKYNEMISRRSFTRL